VFSYLFSVVLSNLYVYGGAYPFSVAEIIEGFLSSQVQGLARDMHEVMIPFAIFGWVFLIVEAKNEAKTTTTKRKGLDTTMPSDRIHSIITTLQFFVGGLVTLGGAAFALSGTYPIGTLLGSIHLAVGLTGVFAGYAFLKRKTWSRRFLILVNSLTIGYSAFAETLAEIYAYLPRGINDALIGTIITIIVSAAIVYMALSSLKRSDLQKQAKTGDSRVLKGRLGQLLLRGTCNSFVMNTVIG
jgi:hypothetical protein